MLAAVCGAFPSGWPVQVDHDQTMINDDHILDLENGLFADDDDGGRYFGLPISNEADLFFEPLSPDPAFGFALDNGFYDDDCRFSQEGEGDSATPSEKKLTHNAYERSRRRKLNDLYSTLRSLLPYTSRQKRLSIPSTIAEALIYIPELQNRIAKLTKRKEEILSTAARRQLGNACVVHNTSSSDSSYPVVSTAFIGDREITVQICYLTSDAPHGGGVSRIIGCIESEEFRLINASTSRIDDDRTSCRLHVQVRGSIAGERSDFTNTLENMIREALSSR